LSIYLEVFTLMLGLGVLLYSFFPGPQHFVHGVYYLLRYFVTEDVKPVLGRTTFDVGIPELWGDVWLCLVTLLLTVPQPRTDDFVFVPYFVLHVMGFGSPVWLTVLGGAFFTVYMSMNPAVLSVCLGALLSRYLTGRNRRMGLIFCGISHLLMSFFEPFKFSFLSVCVVVFLAECKLRLNWQWEVMPPGAYVLLSGPVYVMNYFMWGWTHRWKYTDKVWRSPDIIFPVLNIAAGIYLSG
jgi:hypothetical protein